MSLNMVRVIMGVFGLLAGLLLGTWASADDRYGVSKDCAYLNQCTQLDKAYRYVTGCIAKGQELLARPGVIQTMTKRQQYDALVSGCTDIYLRALQDRVALHERLVEGLSKRLYPEATAPAQLIAPLLRAAPRVEVPWDWGMPPRNLNCPYPPCDRP